MHAKISHNSTTIGRSNVAGWRWLCPADSSSKHSGGNDSSGSCSHNSEGGHNRESSGKEYGNGSEKRGASSANHANTKVQLRTWNEHRFRTWGQSEEAVGGGGLESGIPGIERQRGGVEDAFNGRRSEGRAHRGAERNPETAARENGKSGGDKQDGRRCISGRKQR